MPWKYNNVIIRAGKSWRDDNGVLHPSTWSSWSEAEKIAAGLVWENDPEPFDDRFYTGRDSDGNLIPKDLDDLKSYWKKQTNETAYLLLQPTDYVHARRAEDNDYIIPQATLTYREDVRTSASSIKTSIDNCSTLDQFMDLFDVAEGEEKPPINNWPDPID